MKTHTIVFIAAFLLGLSAQADEPRFAIMTPQEEQFSAFELHDPDQDVRTLGTPEIAFDLSASADTLLDLRIRRSHLTLPNGAPFTAFAGHTEHNLIVIAGGPVAHVTITGVSAAGSSREVLVLFTDAHGTLIAPSSDQVAVFEVRYRVDALVNAAIDHVLEEIAEHVGTGSAFEHVGTAAASEEIIACAADEIVVGRVAIEPITAVGADEALEAIDRIDIRSRRRGAGADIDAHAVDTEAAEVERIVTGTSDHRVVAQSAADVIVARTCIDVIVP